MENIYGKHLTLRLNQILANRALDSQKIISKFLVDLVSHIDMRILSGPLTGYEPGDSLKSGCSGVVILYESHIAIHTYPGRGELFLDIFSCKDFSTEKVMSFIQKCFGEFEVEEIAENNRGFHWSNKIDSEMKKWLKSK